MRLVDFRGARGLEEAEVCFGAGGGLRSPATYSKIGASLAKTLFRSASKRPSCSGIHVPESRPSCQLQYLNRLLRQVSSPSHTLVFAVTTLHFLMHALLHFTFEDSGSCGLVETSSLQNVCCIHPIICSPSHNTVAIDFQLVHWVLEGANYVSNDYFGRQKLKKVIISKREQVQQKESLCWGTYTAVGGRVDRPHVRHVELSLSARGEPVRFE